MIYDDFKLKTNLWSHGVYKIYFSALSVNPLPSNLSYLTHNFNLGEKYVFT